MHLLAKSPYGPIRCLLCCRDRAGHSSITAAQPLNYLCGLAGHWRPERGRLSPDFCLPLTSPIRGMILHADKSPGDGGGRRWGQGQRDYYEGIPTSTLSRWWDVSIRTAGGRTQERLGKKPCRAASSPRHLCRNPNHCSDHGKSQAKPGSLNEVSQPSGKSVWRPTLFSE